MEQLKLMNFNFQWKGKTINTTFRNKQKEDFKN